MPHFDSERLILGYLLDNKYNRSADCILSESSVLEEFRKLRKKGRKLQLKLLGLNLSDILEDFFNCKDLISDLIDKFPGTFSTVPKVATLVSQVEVICQLGLKTQKQAREVLRSIKQVKGNGKQNKLNKAFNLCSTKRISEKFELHMPPFSSSHNPPDSHQNESSHNFENSLLNTNSTSVTGISDIEVDLLSPVHNDLHVSVDHEEDGRNKRTPSKRKGPVHKKNLSGDNRKLSPNKDEEKVQSFFKNLINNPKLPTSHCQTIANFINQKIHKDNNQAAYVDNNSEVIHQKISEDNNPQSTCDNRIPNDKISCLSSELAKDPMFFELIGQDQSDTMNVFLGVEDGRSLTTPQPSTSPHAFDRMYFSNDPHPFMRSAVMNENTNAEIDKQLSSLECSYGNVPVQVDVQQEFNTDVPVVPVQVTTSMFSPGIEEIPPDNSSAGKELPSSYNRKRKMSSPCSIPAKRRKSIFDLTNASLSESNSTFDEDITCIEAESSNTVKTQLSPPGPKNNFTSENCAMEGTASLQNNEIVETSTDNTPVPLTENVCLGMTQDIYKNSNILSPGEHSVMNKEICNKSTDVIDSNIVIYDNKYVNNISPKTFSCHINALTESNMSLQRDNLIQCSDKINNSEVCSENVQEITVAETSGVNNEISKNLSDTISLSGQSSLNNTPKSVAATPTCNTVCDADKQEQITSPSILTCPSPYSPMKQLRTNVRPVNSPLINSKYLSGTPDHVNNYTLTELTALECHDEMREFTVQGCPLTSSDAEATERVPLNLQTEVIIEAPESTEEVITKKTSPQKCRNEVPDIIKVMKCAKKPKAKSRRSPKAKNPKKKKEQQIKMVNAKTRRSPKEKNPKKKKEQQLKMVNVTDKSSLIKNVKSGKEKSSAVSTKSHSTKKKVTSKLAQAFDDEDMSDGIKLALNAFRDNPIVHSYSFLDTKFPAKKDKSPQKENEAISFTESEIDNLIEEMDMNAKGKAPQSSDGDQPTAYSPNQSVQPLPFGGNSFDLSKLLSHCENEKLYSGSKKLRKRSSSVHISPKVSNFNNRACKSTPRHRSYVRQLDFGTPDKNKSCVVNSEKAKANLDFSSAINNAMQKVRENQHYVPNLSNIHENSREYRDMDVMPSTIEKVSADLYLSEDESSSTALLQAAFSHPSADTIQTMTNYSVLGDTVGSIDTPGKNLECNDFTLSIIPPSTPIPNKKQPDQFAFGTDLELPSVETPINLPVRTPSIRKYPSGPYSDSSEGTHYQQSEYYSPLRDNLEEVLVKVALLAENLPSKDSMRRDAAETSLSNPEVNSNALSQSVVIEEVSVSVEVKCPTKPKRGRPRLNQPKEPKPTLKKTAAKNTIKGAKLQKDVEKEKSLPAKKSTKRSQSKTLEKANHKKQAVNEVVKKKTTSRSRSKSSSKAADEHKNTVTDKSQETNSSKDKSQESFSNKAANEHKNTVNENSQETNISKESSSNKANDKKQAVKETKSSRQRSRSRSSTKAGEEHKNTVNGKSQGTNRSKEKSQESSSNKVNDKKQTVKETETKSPRQTLRSRRSTKVFNEYNHTVKEKIQDTKQSRKKSPPNISNRAPVQRRKAASEKTHVTKLSRKKSQVNASDKGQAANIFSKDLKSPISKGNSAGGSKLKNSRKNSLFCLESYSDSSDSSDAFRALEKQVAFFDKKCESDTNPKKYKSKLESNNMPSTSIIPRSKTEPLLSALHLADEKAIIITDSSSDFEELFGDAENSLLSFKSMPNTPTKNLNEICQSIVSNGAMVAIPTPSKVNPELYLSDNDDECDISLSLSNYIDIFSMNL